MHCHFHCVLNHINYETVPVTVGGWEGQSKKGGRGGLCLYLWEGWEGLYQWRDCTCGFANGEPEPNAGVTERHDSSHNGEKPEPVKVWNLAQQDLEGAKDQHEGIVGDL